MSGDGPNCLSAGPEVGDGEEFKEKNRKASRMNAQILTWCLHG